MAIARTARAALTKSSPVIIWLGYFEKCSRVLIMRTLSLSEAKMKLSELVEAIHTTDEEVVITKNGSPAAVMVSIEEFESWRETLRITADSGFMGEIRTGLAGLRKTKKLYTLEELFQ